MRMINVHGYDVVTYGSFYEEYVAEAYALNEVGDYSSEPVLSEAGYHIIKIDSIQDDYESVSDTIAQSLHTVSDEDVYYRLNDLISEAKETANIKRKMKFNYYVEPETTEEIVEDVEEVEENETADEEDAQQEEASEE